MLFMLLDAEAAQAYGQNAKAMVACVIQVTWGEFMVDDVVKELVRVKQVSDKMAFLHGFLTLRASDLTPFLSFKSQTILKLMFVRRS